MKAAVCLLLATVAFGQTKPNFSGIWKQDNARSSFGDQPAPMSVTNTIDHKNPAIHVIETIVGPQGDSITNERDLTTDGREKATKTGNGTEKASVKWDGNTLVFEYKRESGPLTQERWTLSSDGTTLTKERSMPKQKLVLIKQ